MPFCASTRLVLRLCWRQVHQLTWSQIVEDSGVSQVEIEAASALYIAAQGTIACWAMGLTQHKNGGGEHSAKWSTSCSCAATLVDLAPACVQCAAIAMSKAIAPWGSGSGPNPLFLAGLAEVFNFTPPSQPGYDAVAAIKAMHAGRVDVFVAMGGNFLSATPDTVFTAQALRRCALTVQISTNTQSLPFGDRTRSIDFAVFRSDRTRCASER